MPFTFSHPAIVLPLIYLPRKWISSTGLIIGSILPDFEYYIRMKVQSNYAHTISGLFWFDLPLALIICFLYHNIVRDRFLDNLPTVLKRRVSIFRQFNWNRHFKNNWVAVILSLLVGSASHILWDSFTHADGYFVQKLPALSNEVEILNLKTPIFKILQHSSTIIGASVIVIVLFRLPIKREINPPSSSKYWVIVSGIIATIIAVRLLNGLDVKLYGHVIVTAISAFLIALVLTPLALSFRK